MQKSFLLFTKWMTALLNAVLIVAVAVLVLDVVWGVFTRYALGQQASWTEELARILLIWVTLLGGAAAFGIKGHLGVDYFVEKLHPQTRWGMAIFANCVVLFFAIAIFVVGGVQVVSLRFALEQLTTLGLEKGYVYLVLPVSGFFMVLFTIENILELLNQPATAIGEAETESDVLETEGGTL
jgi:TRAP-type C4-dicarboxylate transport system permease small subunit